MKNKKNSALCFVCNAIKNHSVITRFLLFTILITPIACDPINFDSIDSNNKQKTNFLIYEVNQSCGTEFPINCTNTGFVGAGLSEADLAYTGSINVTVAGTTLERMDIRGNVTIHANNVTIRNCRIYPVNGGWPVLIYSPATGTVIEYTELRGTLASAACVGGDNYTARYCNVSGAVDGLYAGENVTIDHCYIHDLGIGPGAHNDGVQQTTGNNSRIQYNTFNLSGKANSSIIIQTDRGAIDTVIIDNNILNGGNYTVYSVAGAFGGVPTNVSITNNLFNSSFIYGVSSLQGTVTWTNNRLYETNVLIPPTYSH